MTTTSSKSKWARTRRNLVTLIVLLGGMTLYCLASGRPGDFEAGLVGAVIGLVLAMFVVGVEWVGGKLFRTGSKPNDKEPSTDEASGAT